MPGMEGYRSLRAWQVAQEVSLGVLKATDGPTHPRVRSVLDQLRRAAVSVDVNIVEGYALGTIPQFRRHLRIALGSAAECERLLTIAAQQGYLPPDVTTPLLRTVDEAIACLTGLLRSRKLQLTSPNPTRGRPTAN
jgi:four helix bundle protein